MHNRYNSPDNEEYLDPYQELALAEEFYTRTLELGRTIPKDEMSQDMYMASLDEAKCVLKEAKQKVAAYEADIVEQNLDDADQYERSL